MRWLCSTMAGWVFAVSLALVSPGRAADPVSVTFPGEGVMLAGLLVRPPGPGPFPAVVALHGCGGLLRRGTELQAREAQWAARLSAEGFAVLFPDSFGPRGLGSQCRVADRRVRASRERRSDAHAARRWLQAQPWVDKAAVSLLGWSNGGSTTLYAMRDSAGAAALVGDTPDFRQAIAFYPGCRALAEAQGGYRARRPLTILVGEADDWTPAEPCRALSAAAGGTVSLVTYPGAYHDFDHPDLPLSTRRGLAFTGDGSGVAHAGSDPAARADALQRVIGILKR